MGKIYKQLKHLWNSPTLMTWASFASRSLSLVIVIPLIVTRLNTSEAALWFLFSSILSLQILADLGLSPTFARVIAYSMAGAETFELGDFRHRQSINSSGQPNWNTLNLICQTMRTVNLRITLITVFVLILLGTLAVFNPISELTKPVYGWASWSILSLSLIISLLGNVYSAFLQGVNKIALLRRWESVFALCAIFSNCLVLILGTGLIGLVISNQCWLIASILRNRLLARHVLGGKFRSFHGYNIDTVVFKAVWPSAWRSSLGSFMNYGIIQASGLIYAQTSSSSSVAAYLLSLKILQMIRSFSSAPFYSKIPLMSQLKAEGDIRRIISISSKGMSLSFWSFLVPFILIGIFSKPILISLDSNVSFAPIQLWYLMGLAFLIERFGAMHIQLYSLTNHIIWHIVNGVSGTVNILVCFLLYKHIGIYAFPVGLLLGYICFTSWYPAMHSYNTYNISFWKFERYVSLPPLLVTVLYGALILASRAVHLSSFS